MPASLPNYVRLTLIVAAIGLAVAGCGRKGDLDPPSAMATKNGDASKPTKQPGVADKPFVLDPLL
ncbi:LPS translocon maturation chaperone LptM [Oryzifoliimicrobium ureilyticus]|uniref:LPS translocon maturation chaperone LptM n=1 Tax=Oryzifoliimicrobium ureilyticus TaxID=3113724 RepID=UPI0030760A43